MRAAATVNTCLVVGAVPTCQGYSLFPKLFKYNEEHNDSINKSNENELKETKYSVMNPFSQIPTPRIRNLW